MPQRAGALTIYPLIPLDYWQSCQKENSLSWTCDLHRKFFFPAFPIHNVANLEPSLFFSSVTSSQIDPAFTSYDLAPPTPLPPLFRQQVVSLSQSSCVSSVELTDGRGGLGGGGGAKSYDGEKALSSLKHSILQYSNSTEYNGLGQDGSKQPRVRAGGTPTFSQFVNNGGP
jgi:hypothetical protein